MKTLLVLVAVSMRTTGLRVCWETSSRHDDDCRQIPTRCCGHARVEIVSPPPGARLRVLVRKNRVAHYPSHVAKENKRSLHHSDLLDAAPAEGAYGIGRTMAADRDRLLYWNERYIYRMLGPLLPVETESCRLGRTKIRALWKSWRTGYAML